MVILSIFYTYFQFISYTFSACALIVTNRFILHPRWCSHGNMVHASELDLWAEKTQY